MRRCLVFDRAWPGVPCCGLGLGQQWPGGSDRARCRRSCGMHCACCPDPVCSELAEQRPQLVCEQRSHNGHSHRVAEDAPGRDVWQIYT